MTDLVIAHWSWFGPGRSGLYETVKELVKYENRISGVRAGIIESGETEDAIRGGKKDPIDPKAQTLPHSWAYKEANLHIIHSQVTKVGALMKPKIFMIHGTPEATLHNEMRPYDDKYAFTACLQYMEICDATVVQLNRHYQLWKPFDRKNNLYYAPKGIDLERYRPDGMKMILRRHPAILFGETWRPLKEPYLVFHAVNKYYEKNCEARLYAFGSAHDTRMWNAMVRSAGFNHLLGEYDIAGLQTFPEMWFRAGDMVVSPFYTGEPSRVTMEALACGCPVISWDCDYYGDNFATKKAKTFSVVNLADKMDELWIEIQADEKAIRASCRQVAEDHYDMKVMAERFVEICRKVVDNES